MFILSICLVSSLVLDTILLMRIDENVASADLVLVTSDVDEPILLSGQALDRV